MNNEFDMDQLNDLADGDSEILKELLDSFFECADNCIADLSKNVHGNPEAWKEHAHALKGISLNFGATRLAEVSKTAEKTQELTVEERQELLKQIKNCYENIQQYCSKVTAS